MSEEVPSSEELRQRWEAAKAREAEARPKPAETTTPKETDSPVIRESKPIALDRSKRGWSIFFFVVAILFGVGGCNVAYNDAKVVGGDAYNYIIGAGRGTAIVGLGVICGLISLVLAVYDLTTVIIHYHRSEK